jgi:hypothetical protein
MKFGNEPNIPVFEPLEPRILLSASVAPETTQAAVNIDVTEKAVTEEQMVHEIAFVDSSVENYADLIEDMNSNVEVYILDKDQNGIDQISSILSGMEGITAIHIISHGEDGEISLGNSQLTSSNIDSFEDTLSGWSHSLTNDADLLIYGCNVAQDTDFVDSLAEYTGADVAASDDITGSEHLGGDAILEVTTGSIESETLLNQNTLNDANIRLAGSDLPFAGTTQADLQALFDAADDGDTIVFSSNITINFTSQIKHKVVLLFGLNSLSRNYESCSL